MTCKNCGATHGCGCKARKAQDGTECCTKCVAAYNMKIAGKGNVAPKKSGVTVLYKAANIQVTTEKRLDQH